MQFGCTGLISNVFNCILLREVEWCVCVLGAKHPYTVTGQHMLEVCNKLLNEVRAIKAFNC